MSLFTIIIISYLACILLSITILLIMQYKESNKLDTKDIIDSVMISLLGPVSFIVIIGVLIKDLYDNPRTLIQKRSYDNLFKSNEVYKDDIR